MPPAPLVNLDNGMAHSNDRIIPRKCIKDSPHFFWMPPIVSIEKANYLAAAKRNTQIECRGLATIVLDKETNSRLPLAYKICSPIRGAIIYDHDFQVDWGFQEGRQSTRKSR